jgi:hypothetical protein
MKEAENLKGRNGKEENWRKAKKEEKSSKMKGKWDFPDQNHRNNMRYIYTAQETAEYLMKM